MAKAPKLLGPSANRLTIGPHEFLMTKNLDSRAAFRIHQLNFVSEKWIHKVLVKNMEHRQFVASVRQSTNGFRGVPGK
jgi:hypothetical protein